MSHSVFDIASSFVLHTNKSIFLTGKAGTGKTTFLKQVVQACTKNLVVVAPTGVAAINAGGVTIHSFFNLPFSPYLPQGNGWGNGDSAVYSNTQLLNKVKLNSEKIELLQALELLIIDEVSMVRADVLDAIDAILRHYRKQYQAPFGGVQLLCIGDVYQLPPVVSDTEWPLLQQVYATPYFFSSLAFAAAAPLCIELDRVYRQQEGNFIRLLNQVRNNEFDEDGYDMLQALQQHVLDNDVGVITLTSHNAIADDINQKALAALPGMALGFEAIIEGEFSEKSYPADAALVLKVGAQVMFIKNDTERIRRYYNGKIGIVTALDTNVITVHCEGDDSPIAVEKTTWNNTRYKLNTNSQSIEEEVVGSFTQFPLRLAWAVTIHKSQGLTFDKVKIDAGKAFAPGQVYVALSRCTRLDGIQLLSSLTANAIRTDPRIVAFSQTQKTPVAQLPFLLEEARISYQQMQLYQWFGDIQLSKALIPLINAINTAGHQCNPNPTATIVAWGEVVTSLTQVAKRFKSQLQQLLPNDCIPEESAALQQRLRAAAGYFVQQLQPIVQALAALEFACDSKPQAKQLLDKLQRWNASLQKYVAVYEHIYRKGYSPIIISEALQQPIAAWNKKVYATQQTTMGVTDCMQPALLQQLKQARDTYCNENDVAVYLVANLATLVYMANCMPTNTNELAQIPGFGPKKVAQYGELFLPIIEAYVAERNITERLPLPSKKPKEKTSTAKAASNAITLQMFLEGNDIATIAATRNLSVGTIESHLTGYIADGTLDIKQLVTPELLEQLNEAIATLDWDISQGYKALKEQLNFDVSFAALRWWQAHQQYLAAKNDAAP
ncbi:MAG: helix-turn-helix domain-containing protein [Chitinophagaceae bacterium]